jgi:tRNA-splicing ligase RtcB
MSNFEIIEGHGKPIKAWTKGVPVEESAKQQLRNVSEMPFIHKHVAVMPDVHFGLGATIGSVIATVGAVIPAAVGVDIGCGMCAVQTDMSAKDLPDNLAPLRSAIEAAVPHGRTKGGDKGSWGTIPDLVVKSWRNTRAAYAQAGLASASLESRFNMLCGKHEALKKTNNMNHLGTLGTGNHFIEICLDENDCVWIMLHSGSRGVGNRVGTYFIEKAKEDMRIHHINLKDKDLSYLSEGTQHFDEYVEAVEWAQDFASVNRERHFGTNCLVTRKGAVKAALGDLGIIPGSMGARSFIVRGLGNRDSFHSCSHGAGRVMSRTQAKAQFTVDDHIKATEGVECRKDKSVIDETPMAYKDIDAVMKAQDDLVEILYTLKQVVCVKG